METVCREETIALQRCRDGSKKAFEVVVEKYMKRAYLIALGLVGNRDDALDLSQEAFFRAYCNIGKLRENASFFPWFYQILKNLCFSHLRKVRGRQTCCFDEQKTDVAASEYWEPGAVAARNETKALIWKAIGQLDSKHREVIVLRHFQNLSYGQIAQVMFCSKGTVMSRLYNARRQMKRILSGPQE